MTIIKITATTTANFKMARELLASLALIANGVDQIMLVNNEATKTKPKASKESS